MSILWRIIPTEKTDDGKLLYVITVSSAVSSLDANCFVTLQNV
jgi:hypothetical protein